MQRDPRAYLWDAREATEAILEFVAGKTSEDYARDRLLRSAVERQFEIIGEAQSIMQNRAAMGRPYPRCTANRRVS